MKAYAVWEKDTRDEYAELVFAHNAKEAMKAAWWRPYGPGFDDWLLMRAARIKQADEYANNLFDIAWVCHDLSILRQAGWTCEDGNECAQCGLNDFEDDRWVVCGECYHCPECGHDDGCTGQGV